MQREIIINGRLIGPRNVELDQPVANLSGEVEVTLRPRPNGAPGESLSAFLQSLPPGTRTREDIDQQLNEEKDAWEDKD